MFQRKKNDWELGGKINDHEFIDKHVTKFNNIQKQKIWNHTDSKDAKFIALTTKVENLHKAFASSAQDDKKDGGGCNEFHSSGNSWKKTIPEWKRKKMSKSIVRDDKIY